MIAKLFALAQGQRATPPSRLSPLIGTACILIGVRLVQSWADYQRQVIAAQAQELGSLAVHFEALHNDARPTYPGRQDVDPLDRAEGDD